jgi:hypothetical protein
MFQKGMRFEPEIPQARDSATPVTDNSDRTVNRTQCRTQ